MRSALRGARAAFVFMTRLPVGGFPYSTGEWRWAAAWFPLVGTAVGGAAALAWWLAAPLGPWVAATCALVASVLVTGAFHEDGLADTADALGGALDRSGIRAVLKDPRVGAFGALALAISVAFRLVLLAQLGAGAASALLLAHGLARLGPVWLMAALPYVSEEGTAKSRPVARAGTAQGVWASVIALAVAGGVVRAASTLDWAGAAAALAATALATALCGWRFRARAGGVTGDFLGATEQVNEIVILLALLAVQAAVPGAGP